MTEVLCPLFAHRALNQPRLDREGRSERSTSFYQPGETVQMLRTPSLALSSVAAVPRFAMDDVYRIAATSACAPTHALSLPQRVFADRRPGGRGYGRLRIGARCRISLIEKIWRRRILWAKQACSRSWCAHGGGVLPSPSEVICVHLPPASISP
ncbi:hypothetical protein OH77DRAFT_662395 [Trametes cingulata]|nr:hypothetical protein OH77DRAFT_662395 [Trametes cingulata]